MSAIKPLSESEQPDLKLIQRCIEDGHIPVTYADIGHHDNNHRIAIDTGAGLKVLFCKRCGLSYWST